MWLFRHQRVWCPSRRQMAHMRPLPEGGLGARDVLVLGALPPEGPEREALPFLGPPMEHQLAEGIARGGCNRDSAFCVQLDTGTRVDANVQSDSTGGSG